MSPLPITTLPIDGHEFAVFLFPDRDGREHVALRLGELKDPVLARIHSECLTGDVFGSQRCDCGDQRDAALKEIMTAGAGLFVYLRQEGRGIGLRAKLDAYALQDQGYDTVDANLKLGHAMDERDYGMAAHILKALNVRSVRLLTNNPAKIAALQQAGVAAERQPLLSAVNPFNSQYLQTKAERMDHILGDLFP